MNCQRAADKERLLMASRHQGESGESIDFRQASRHQGRNLRAQTALCLFKFFFSGQPPPRPRTPGPPARPMPGESRVASAPFQVVVAILSYSGCLTKGLCDSIKNTRHLYFQFKFRVSFKYISISFIIITKITVITMETIVRVR